MALQTNLSSVADPEGGHGGVAPSKIGQKLAKLAHFLPILASTPPTDHLVLHHCPSPVLYPVLECLCIYDLNKNVEFQQ